ncbi:hypothetical protein OMAG_001302 [Candidatus Omnitrophus magneticus]|uniref:Uncharacterized protein n=1 Tax=Candidatus Omnitrophus magneticus TaxID=1609969 RepID=A0A0F0CTT8_9BACT|nr:hypothetical protein OMAG_001302 [Candidatus Omnitrophus magneticus]
MQNELVKELVINKEGIRIKKSEDGRGTSIALGAIPVPRPSSLKIALKNKKMV